ncbi:hypothetical protein [Cutibacterium namnetense]|nr:hypothetical protein [Cutibacterium namnetense]
MDHLDELVKGLRKIRHRFAHRRRSDTSANEDNPLRPSHCDSLT